MPDPEQEAGERAHSAWRLRPVFLAALGGVAAIAIQQLVDRGFGYGRSYVPLESWRIALSVGIGTGAMAFGFGAERIRLLWAAGFALLAGAVAALVYYWNGGQSGWSDVGDWRYASLFLSIAIAVPLFQTARDEGGWHFPYREVHAHAWTNVVLWFACWIFVGIVFALAWLLAALFDLIGLHVIREMLRRDWFAAGLAGAAFGSALGLFRERDRIVRLLQHVVTAVLAVLAPVLGAGLLLFLVALPFTGLGALWEATKSTTPILLGCVIGALILANAVIGNGEDEEATNPLLRWGAMALGLAMLPLCVIAAIATGLRIAQYGFTPDRLWALVFVMLATVYGVAYLMALGLGRNGWAARVRPANLRMAFIVAAVALFLATPILSFNAISTWDQVARLESGRIAPDKFDWAALGFDFGDPGKAAVKRLAASKNSDIADRAKQAMKADSRYGVEDIDRTRKVANDLARRLRVLPAGTAVPEGLRTLLTDWSACGESKCTMLYSPGAVAAVLIKDDCVEGAARDPSSRDMTLPGLAMGSRCVIRYARKGDTWRLVVDGDKARPDAAGRAALKSGLADGKVEIRTVPSRRVFIGGVPVGEPFE
ncbi:DUF4153 domain-containing protein [Sphingomonas sp. QA11]|uniref:DUF4153 domain-containing protein n=1 Tax=Sphingomonas sp. QA11 TaxID=2950605 RepID=UPI00234BF207|nr:DUF4153 domain-containing protein [Sphingomonas sp. QA11]WCM29280.1 DUF4153 domain-containing protein [Sphingomonas sp. QA11]